MATKLHNVKIVRYFFPETYVKAHQDHDPSGVKDGTVQTVSHNIEELPTENLRHGVSVRVSSDESQSENQPYTYVVEAFGIFEPDLSDSEEKVEDYRNNVGVVGVQTLFGAIREHLASVTARSPWSTFTINTVNIVIETKAKSETKE